MLLSLSYMLHVNNKKPQFSVSLQNKEHKLSFLIEEIGSHWRWRTSRCSWVLTTFQTLSRPRDKWGSRESSCMKITITFMPSIMWMQHSPWVTISIHDFDEFDCISFRFDNSSLEQKNDLALLETNETIEFGVHVKPICLPNFPDFPLEGEKLLMAGWGLSNFGGYLRLSSLNTKSTNYLTCAAFNLEINADGQSQNQKIPPETSFKVISERDCKKEFCPLSHYLIGTGELCFGRGDDGGKGACQVSASL